MKSIYRHLNKKNLDIIGAAVSEGQPHKGTELGPEFLRKGGLLELSKLLGWEVTDKGDISINNIEIEKHLDKSKYKFGKVNNCLEIGALNKAIYKSVKESALKRNFVLTLGGDHSIGSATLTGLREAYPKLKVIWVDAHPDINTPDTTLYNNYHGMPVSHVVGLTPHGAVPGFDWLKTTMDFCEIAFIGIRQIDAGERDFLNKHNILNYDMNRVTDLGIGRVMKEIHEYFSSQESSHSYPTHISFDIDGIDPLYIQQTGTIVRGGLSDREAKLIIRKTVETENLVSLDLVELNPLLGSEHDKKDRERQQGDFAEIHGSQSVCLSLELIKAALGERLV